MSMIFTNVSKPNANNSSSGIYSNKKIDYINDVFMKYRLEVFQINKLKTKLNLALEDKNMFHKIKNHASMIDDDIRIIRKHMSKAKNEEELIWKYGKTIDNTNNNFKLLDTSGIKVEHMGRQSLMERKDFNDYIRDELEKHVNKNKKRKRIVNPFTKEMHLMPKLPISKSSTNMFKRPKNPINGIESANNSILHSGGDKIKEKYKFYNDYNLKKFQKRGRILSPENEHNFHYKNDANYNFNEAENTNMSEIVINGKSELIKESLHPNTDRAKGVHFSSNKSIISKTNIHSSNRSRYDSMKAPIRKLTLTEMIFGKKQEDEIIRKQSIDPDKKANLKYKRIKSKLNINDFKNEKINTINFSTITKEIEQTKLQAVKALSGYAYNNNMLKLNIGNDSENKYKNKEKSIFSDIIKINTKAQKLQKLLSKECTSAYEKLDQNLNYEEMFVTTNEFFYKNI